MPTAHPFAALVLSTLAAGAAAAALEQPPSRPDPRAGESSPAQPEAAPGPNEPQAGEQALDVSRPTTVEIRVRSELAFNSGLRDEPGDVTVSRLGGGIGVVIPVRRQAQLDLGLDYEYSHYAFSDATGFIAGTSSPWENIHRETLSLRFTQQQSQRLAWFVGGAAGFSHEDGADLSDSLVGSAHGGVRYAVTQKLFLGAGAVLVTQLEDSPLVYPLLTLDWRITDRTRLTNAGRLGLTLAYDVSEQLTFSLGGWYERREFRLRDDGPAPDGVGRDQRVPVAAGISYRPSPQLSIDLAGGAFLWQSYRLADSNNDTIADIDARAAPFASLSVGYRF